MKIEFIERNYDIGKRLRTLIETKIEKLDRYFDDDAVARVVCSEQSKMYKLELTVSNKKFLYRSEVLGENMYDNIDVVLPKIERQIIKASGKRKDNFKQNAFGFENYLFLEDKPKEEKNEVVKKKSFFLDPELLDDAKDKLEELDHDFYVFLNAETGKINIIYKRKDNNLGLIECNY